MPEYVTAIRADDLLRAPGARPTEGSVTLHLADGAIVDAPDGAPVTTLEVPGIALPAMTNGHDHGKPISPVSFGVRDDALELWLPGTATIPAVSQELAALVYFARSARAGIAASILLHTLKPPEKLLEDAKSICGAAETVGVRVGFGVPLSDRNHLAYGDGGADARILSTCGLHPDEVAIMPSQVPTTTEAVALVDEIAARHQSDLVHVQFGPLAPHWISDELALAVAERSAETGRRIHMHLLETRRQREWADAAHPQGLLVHLDELGLLSERLSVAHGVFLTPQEMDLLAERGVTVSTNPSSNLRLRNGIAPVVAMLRSGLKVALGLDGRAFDDDADYLREVRLLSYLHAGDDLTPALGLDETYRIAIEGGAGAVHGGPGAYGLAPGAPADVVVLRPDLLGDVMAPYQDHASLITTRGTTRDVTHLIVAGRLVVDEGAVVGVDEQAAEAALVDELLSHTDDHLVQRAIIDRLRPVLTDHYERGEHIR